MIVYRGKQMSVVVNQVEDGSDDYWNILLYEQSTTCNYFHKIYVSKFTYVLIKIFYIGLGCNGLDCASRNPSTQWK